MIKEIYEEKLKLKNIDLLESNLKQNLPEDAIITNNHDRSFLVKTNNCSNAELFSQYNCFNDSVSQLFDSDIPIELLYNILPLGSNSYLLKF